MTIDEEAQAHFTADGRYDSLSVALVPEEQVEEERRAMEALLGQFYDSSRTQYPAIDHGRVPDQLTIVLRSVMDEPSGHYEPRDGEEFYEWWHNQYSRTANDVDFFHYHVGGLNEAEVGEWDPFARAYVACLEREDNQWRYWQNDYEEFWNHYSDGSPLDDRLFRTNANGWFKVEIYPSDGPRLETDPCVVIPETLAG